MAIFAATVLILGATNTILLLVLVGRRLSLRRTEHRVQRVEEQLRPVVLEFVHSSGDLPSDLTAHEQGVMNHLLIGYARVLRGSARDRIADYFFKQGTIDREIDMLRGATRAWRRAGAAYRLGDMGSAFAEGALITALEDSDRDVRTAAARSLGRLQSEGAVNALLAALVNRQVPQALIRWSLLQIGETAVPHLRRLMGTSESAERAGAVQMIGILGNASDAEAIEARLRDTSADVREQAAFALGRLGGPRSAAALLLALEDRISTVRVAAATALGRLRDPIAIAHLLDHAASDSFEAAHAAAYAIAAIDPQAAIAAADRGPHLREAADVARLT